MKGILWYLWAMRRSYISKRLAPRAWLDPLPNKRAAPATEGRPLIPALPHQPLTRNMKGGFICGRHVRNPRLAPYRPIMPEITGSRSGLLLGYVFLRRVTLTADIHEDSLVELQPLLTKRLPKRRLQSPATHEQPKETNHSGWLRAASNDYSSSQCVRLLFPPSVLTRVGAEESQRCFGFQH